jgi:hypothetical protein
MRKAGGRLALVPKAAIPLLACLAAACVTRGPYLQLGTPTSVVVRWRTLTATDSEVRFGAAPDSLTSRARDRRKRKDHEIRIRGLAPDTVYYYSVGTTSRVLRGDSPGFFFRTPPVAGTDRRTRVWVLGDSGEVGEDAENVRDAYYRFAGATHTDLWLMLGDNAYMDGTDSEYQAAVFDMYPEMLRTSVLWATLGNHDGHSADSSTETGPYYHIFTLPTAGEAGGLASGTEAYYSFDHANIHFICLDSHDTDRSLGGAMLTWLQHDLANTTQDWVIAFWHHPPYSKGSHDSDTEVQLREMRENALPILEDGGVDLVLAGHSHSYERSFLLDGHYGASGTLEPGMVLDRGDGRPGGDGAYAKPTAGLAAHEGAVYCVSGSSSRVSGSPPLDHPAMFISLNRLGSLVFEVDGDRLDAKWIAAGGEVRDSFTIIKG